MLLRAIEPAPGRWLLPVLLILAAVAAPVRPAVPAAEAAPAPLPVVQATPPAPADVEAIRLSVQATMNLYSEMRKSGDDTLLAQIVDERNTSFLQVVREELKEWRALARQNRLRPANYIVDDIRPMLNGFYQADIVVKFPRFRESGSGSAEANWIFRQVGDRWLLTEPLTEELGPRSNYQTEHFNFRYYAWDADQIERVGRIFEAAYAVDVAKVGFSASDMLTVSVTPTYQAEPRLNVRALASYSRGSVSTAFRVRAPGSYGFGLYPRDEADTTLQGTLQHEYGHHLTYTRMAGRPIKQWMNEGLSDWLMEDFQRRLILTAFNDDQLGTDLLDWAEARFDEGNKAPTREVNIAYALGANAVRYMIEERGGLDQFWALADRNAQTRDFNQSVQDVFGQSWPEFQVAYRAWLYRWAQG